VNLPDTLRHGMQRALDGSQPIRGFVRRHRWSLPLSVLASASLLHLASEVREGELALFDSTVASWVMAWRGQVDGLMLALTTFGSGLWMAALTLAVLLALLWIRRRREAAFLAVCGIGILVLNTALKVFFHRARPQGVVYLISEPASFSFPSGHAMASMGVLSSVVVTLYVMRLPRFVCHGAASVALLLALGVAISRVYFGVHYASDVLGGELAAAAWVSATTGWFYPGLLPGEKTKEPAPGQLGST
jgi:undecaprenyl-diphosphatase